MGHEIRGYGKSCDMSLPLSHMAKSFLVPAVVAGASCVKEDGEQHLRAGRYAAAICRAFLCLNESIPIS